MNPTLGARLAAILRRKNLTISELARMTKVHRVTLSKIVHDRDSNPTVDTLQAIASALRVGMADLVGNSKQGSASS